MRYIKYEVYNMNDRGLKTRTVISNSIDTNLFNQLKELSKITMIPMSKLLDKAIQLILKEYIKK